MQINLYIEYITRNMCASSETSVEGIYEQIQISDKLNHLTSDMGIFPR